MKYFRLYFGIFVILIGVFVTWLMNDIEAKSDAAKSWPHVIGTITKSERHTDGPYIRYRYEVEDQTHTSGRLIMGVVVGDDITFADGTSISDAGLLKRFPQGANVPVYYDPSKPSRSVLISDAEHNTDLPRIFFGYLFVFGGFVYLLACYTLSGSRRPAVTTETAIRTLVGTGMLVAGIAIIHTMNGIRAEARMARSWPVVPATIKVAHVWTDHPEVVYEYSIAGRVYEGDTMFIGIPTRRITLEDGTELWPRQLNRRFAEGATIEIRVDPDDPTNTVLIPEARHNTDVPRYIGFAFALFGPLISLFGKSPGRRKEKAYGNLRQR